MASDQQSKETLKQWKLMPRLDSSMEKFPSKCGDSREIYAIKTEILQRLVAEHIWSATKILIYWSNQNWWILQRLFGLTCGIQVSVIRMKITAKSLSETMSKHLGAPEIWNKIMRRVCHNKIKIASGMSSHCGNFINVKRGRRPYHRIMMIFEILKCKEGNYFIQSTESSPESCCQ